MARGIAKTFIEWVRVVVVVEQIWEGLESLEKCMLEVKSTRAYEEEMARAIAAIDINAWGKDINIWR